MLGSVAPSFLPAVVERMIKVLDDAAFATTHFLDTYYSPEWLREKGFDLTTYAQNLENFFVSGRMPETAVP